MDFVLLRICVMCFTGLAYLVCDGWRFPYQLPRQSLESSSRSTSLLIKNQTCNPLIHKV